MAYKELPGGVRLHGVGGARQFFAPRPRMATTRDCPYNGTNAHHRLIRTIVGAIPCGCPAWPYLTGIVPCGCP